MAGGRLGKFYHFFIDKRLAVGRTDDNTVVEIDGYGNIVIIIIRKPAYQGKD